MTDHIEPLKYFVIAVPDFENYPDDYLKNARKYNLPPMQTYPCYSLAEAVQSATLNAAQDIECLVCCTDRAREVMGLPEHIRSVQSLAMDPAVVHETLKSMAERHDNPSAA